MSPKKTKTSKNASKARPERDLTLEAQDVLDTFGAAVRADRDYPALHLAPPVGRLNDPNGLVYDGHNYHAFYQYSPLHPERKVYWRHAVSTNLADWKDVGTALVPNTRYDSHGCYSGSGIRVKGGFEFFYTGNVKDSKNKREAYQILATAGKDASPVRQLPPLISGPHDGYTAHYRDPHVFERDGKWWMVIGAQRKDKTGAVVVYTSKDRRDWKFKGELGIKAKELEKCYMFECPSLLQLRDEVTGEIRDVLIFSPQGLKPMGEKYLNIYQSGYIVGKFNPKTLKFKVETPFTELDAGFEFYAPQTISGTGISAAQDAPHDETVMIAWFGNAEQDDQPSWSKRWVHMMTFPRELHLRDGKLYQHPVPQLDDAMPLQPIEPDEKGKLKELKDARVFRLRGRLNVADERVKIKIKDTHGVALSIVLDQDFVQMDRGGTRYTEGGSLRRRTLKRAKTRQFELLVDGSAAELFVGGKLAASLGAEVFSARTFFKGEKRRVRLTGGKVLSLEYARKN